MSLYRQPPVGSRARHDFRWDQRFCTRQKGKYKAEDANVLENPATVADLFEAFFDEHQSILNPPCYNYVALKEFLSRADLHQLNARRPALALLDDRRELSGDEGSMRNWESDRYARQPSPGDSVERSVFDESGLLKKLKENVRTLLERASSNAYPAEEDDA